MKRCFHILLLAALSLAGCSQERSRAVNEQSAAGQKDYRQMIQRARTRQNAQNTLAQMQEALQSFQRDMGRLPTNIVELVTRNYIRTIPALSPGQQFAYDPALGLLTIQNVQRPPDTLSPTLPDAPEMTNRPTLSPQS